MADGVLRRKARNAQLIYEDLLDRTGMDGLPVTFVADEGRRSMLSRACYTSNPFPIPLSLVLTKLRIPAVRKLFEDEIIPPLRNRSGKPPRPGAKRPEASDRAVRSPGELRRPKRRPSLARR